jgi:ParB family transcriptional regulator, chromosome partitioning protein
VSSGGVELDRTVNSIGVGSRLRRDLGDLDELCASIQAVGLLQPITITPDGVLVCGARRLAAVKRLGWQTVKVWVTSTVSSRLAEILAEQHENTVRKPFTPSEAAALYTELKQLYAADAARRQQASRFTSEHNPRKACGDGDADSASPSVSARTAAGAARRQAARAITGRDSSWSLEHVIEVQRLAEDQSISESVREIARRELAAMDADGTINGHYLTVQAAARTDVLAALAEDPAQPQPVRQRAAIALEGLEKEQPAPELVKAARAAIIRATSSAGTGDDLTATGCGNDAAGKRPAAIKRYGLRACLAAIEEMDGWWRHYDPSEIAAGLTDEQWQRFCDHLERTTAFIQAIAAARRSRAC